MLHRHPCILKYISSWRKGSTFYLATEDARPLAQVIGAQTTLQICIGLHSILRALIFLHEKALASHNNVCSSSVYVTPEGSWKLGGLEYLCKFSDFNQTYLQKIKTCRYEKGIAPEEDTVISDTPVNPVAIDQYAFGVLTEEVLRLKNAGLSLVFRHKFWKTMRGFEDFFFLLQTMFQHSRISVKSVESI